MSIPTYEETQKIVTSAPFPYPAYERVMEPLRLPSQTPLSAPTSGIWYYIPPQPVQEPQRRSKQAKALFWAVLLAILVIWATMLAIVAVIAFTRP